MMLLFFFPSGKKMANFHSNRSSTKRALGPVDSFAEQTMFFIVYYSHFGFISWVTSFYIHCILKKNYLAIIFKNLIKVQFVTQNRSEGNILGSRAHADVIFFLHIPVALSNMNMPLFCEYSVHQVLQ